jgi:predicted kinase
VATLVLLNGPPAAGKSTLAARWVAGRQLALNLDIDAVRTWIGAWPTADLAWQAARRLALAMAHVHLTDGHDVIVPQFLIHDTFVLELERVARETDAAFVEVALIVGRDDALHAFAVRSEHPENQQHRDASEYVEQHGGVGILGEQYDRFVRLLDARPHTRRVDVARGDVDATFDRFVAAVDGS